MHIIYCQREPVWGNHDANPETQIPHFLPREAEKRSGLHTGRMIQLNTNMKPAGYVPPKQSQLCIIISVSLKTPSNLTLQSLSLLLLVQKYKQLSKFFVLDFSFFLFFFFFYPFLSYCAYVLKYLLCGGVVQELSTLHLGRFFQFTAFWDKNLFLRPANLQLLVNDILVYRSEYCQMGKENHERKKMIFI